MATRFVRFCLTVALLAALMLGGFGGPLEAGARVYASTCTSALYTPDPWPPQKRRWARRMRRRWLRSIAVARCGRRSLARLRRHLVPRRPDVHRALHEALTTRLLLLRAGVERNPGPPRGRAAGHRVMNIEVVSPPDPPGYPEAFPRAEITPDALKQAHARGCAHALKQLERFPAQDNFRAAVLTQVSPTQVGCRVVNIRIVRRVGTECVTAMDEPTRSQASQEIPRARNRTRAAAEAIWFFSATGNGTSAFPMPLSGAGSAPVCVVLDVVPTGVNFNISPAWWTSELSAGFARLACPQQDGEGWLDRAPPAPVAPAMGDAASPRRSTTQWIGPRPQSAPPALAPPLLPPPPPPLQQEVEASPRASTTRPTIHAQVRTAAAPTSEEAASPMASTTRPTRTMQERTAFRRRSATPVALRPPIATLGPRPPSEPQPEPDAEEVEALAPGPQTVPRSRGGDAGVIREFTRRWEQMRAHEVQVVVSWERLLEELEASQQPGLDRLRDEIRADLRAVDDETTAIIEEVRELIRYFDAGHRPNRALTSPEQMLTGEWRARHTAAGAVRLDRAIDELVDAEGRALDHLEVRLRAELDAASSLEQLRRIAEEEFADLHISWTDASDVLENIEAELMAKIEALELREQQAYAAAAAATSAAEAAATASAEAEALRQRRAAETQAAAAAATHAAATSRAEAEAARQRRIAEEMEAARQRELLLHAEARAQAEEARRREEEEHRRRAAEDEARRQAEIARAAVAASAAQTRAAPNRGTAHPRRHAPPPVTASPLREGVIAELQSSLCVPTARKVDPQCKGAFTTLVRSAIGTYDTTHSEDAAIALLLLCKRQLRTVQGQASSRERRSWMMKQLSSPIEAPPLTLPTRPPRQQMEPEELVVRRAVKKAKEGFVGRAAKILATTRAAATTNIVEKLALLHPPGADPVDCPSPTTEVVTVVFSPEAVRKAARKLQSGATPGPTGWTEELVLQALDDPDCARGIAAFLTDIANARVSPTVRELLTTCTLVGIPKPDGGVRPIAMGDVFLKIASTLAQELCEHELRAFFGPNQAGVLNPSGAQGIVHNVRKRIGDCRQAGLATHLATIDLKNAFNSVERQAIWSVVQQPRFRPLQGIFHLEYATPSALLVVDNGVTSRITSRRGTRQGSACGPTFFCFAIQQVIDELNGYATVSALGYMDDLTLVAEDGATLAWAVAKVEAAMRERGLALNPKKCQWVSDVPPPAGWARYTASTLKLLGAHIAMHYARDMEAAEKAALQEEADKHDRFFARLEQVKGPQALAILGKCAVPRMSYVIRTHHPNVTRDPCVAFDRKVTKAWRQLAELEARNVTLTEAITAHLPAKCGGMGLTRTAWIRTGAYEGSLKQAGLLETAATQTVWTAQLNEQLSNALQDDAKKVMEANTAKGASTWFADPTTIMPSRDFAAAMRLRLNAAHPALPARQVCPGCQVSFEARQWSQHVIGCARVVGANASSRHAMVKDAVKKVAKEAGVSYQLAEPRYLGDVTCRGCGEEIRVAQWDAHAQSCPMLLPTQRSARPHASGPDIEMAVGAETIIVDVTVVNPLNASSRSAKPAAAFARSERTKETKYAQMCAAEGCEFVVAAVSAQGALSKSFERLLCRVAPESFFEARRVVVAAAVQGAGRALRNAERQVGAVLLEGDEEERAAERADESASIPPALLAEHPGLWTAAQVATAGAQGLVGNGDATQLTSMLVAPHAAASAARV